MINSTNPNDNKIKGVSGLTPDQEQRIMDFLQGAVYCWCNNHKNNWFSARDLIGGNNRNDWDKTPLGVLYDKHYKDSKIETQAWDAAGRDAGWMLKKVIADDKRAFETKEEDQIRKYKWLTSN